MVVTETKLYQKDEKRRLDTAKEELTSMKYHPVREQKSACAGENKAIFKAKKLKRSNSCDCESLKLKTKLSIACLGTRRFKAFDC